MGKVSIVKMLYNLIIIIIFTFLFQSCSNEKRQESTNIDNDQIASSQNLESGFSSDDHPCLCLTSTSADKISSSTRKSIYKASKYTSQFNALDLFNISVESAILFKHYTQFTHTLESIILRKEINEYFNPKAYFIKAIREISQQKLDDARISLNEFLSIQ